MPLPKFAFEDENAGLPRQPVPVRYACLAADWSPALFVSVVLGRMNDDHPLIKVYEFDPHIQNVGEIPSAWYESLERNLVATRGQSTCQQLTLLPVNHFVWSDDLIWAFSDFIDLTIGRESASGLHVRWTPALGECSAAILECTDVAHLGPAQPLKNSFAKIGEVRSITFNGSQKHMKNSMGLNYIELLLKKPNKAISVEEMDVLLNPRPMGTISTSEAAEEFADGFQSAESDAVMQATDPQAIRETNQALKTLEGRIKEAQDRNNLKQVAELQENYARLKRFRSADVNIHNRPRKDKTPHELLRKSVGAAIRRAIKGVEPLDPLLAKHLDDHIDTGSDCTYRPPIDMGWKF